MENINSLSGWLVRYRYPVLCLLCGLLYLTNLGGYRLFDVDEPRYAETARFMTASGDYVMPVFNGKYRFEKPVLSYWLIAACYKLFGVNEWAARFSSALAALGTVLLTCLVAGRLWSPGLGLAAGTLLASCLQFIALGRMALTDMHLCFFLTGSLVFFYLGYMSENKTSSKLYHFGAFSFAGLSALTKGPVGLILPLAVGAAFIFSTRGRSGIRGSLSFLPGIIAFMAITLPWYILVTLRSDFQFFRIFILQHNFQRFFGEVAPGGQHVQPFYYYLLCLLAGSYPWSFFALQSILIPLPALIKNIRKAGFSFDKRAFPLVWAWTVLLFFSLSRAKLPTYITPAFPPLAILIAAYWANITGGGHGGRQLLIPASLSCACAAVGAIFLSIKGSHLAPFPLGKIPLFTAAILLFGPLVAFVLTYKRRFGAAFNAQTIGQLLFTWLLAFYILPLVSEHRQEPQISLIVSAQALLGDRGTLAAYRYRKTALPFYSRRVVLFLEKDQAASLDTLAGPVTVITRENNRSELLSAVPGLKLISRAGDLVLLGRKE
jgi:4-amino-4-deoxy-L-arabinose transferase-like glycosyltransferase